MDHNYNPLAKYLEEYESLPAKKILSEEEYDKIYSGGPLAVRRLSNKKRQEFFSTQKYLREHRDDVPDLTGFMIGGKTVDEVLAKIKKRA
jgi:hypothetical protein